MILSHTKYCIFDWKGDPLPTKPFVDRSLRVNDENFRMIATNLDYLNLTALFYFDNKGWGVAEENNETQNRGQYVYLLTFDSFAGNFDGITGLNKTWVIFDIQLRASFQT